MPKFEYKYIEAQWMQEPDGVFVYAEDGIEQQHEMLSHALQKFGLAGWEMVAVTKQSAYQALYFKRQISE